jgi:hypothetical protein
VRNRKRNFTEDPNGNEMTSSAEDNEQTTEDESEVDETQTRISRTTISEFNGWTRLVQEPEIGRKVNYQSICYWEMYFLKFEIF